VGVYEAVVVLAEVAFTAIVVCFVLYPIELLELGLQYNPLLWYRCAQDPVPVEDVPSPKSHFHELHYSIESVNCTVSGAKAS
jgi:hypothetical protein